MKTELITEINISLRKRIQAAKFQRGEISAPQNYWRQNFPQGIYLEPTMSVYGRAVFPKR